MTRQEFWDQAFLRLLERIDTTLDDDATQADLALLVRDERTAEGESDNKNSAVPKAKNGPLTAGHDTMGRTLYDGDKVLVKTLDGSELHERIYYMTIRGEHYCHAAVGDNPSRMYGNVTEWDVVNKKTD